jgi:hypothetical protein
MSFFTTAQKRDITNYVNSYRAKHQAPALSWDDSIYGAAQTWASRLLSQHSMQHSGSPSYGENLAYFKGYGTDPVGLVKKAVDAWYAEIALYDFNKPGFSYKTGHFTCLVWVASTKFGMGISIDSKTSEAYVVMNTTPPGNYTGEFAKNVLPLTSANQPSLPVSQPSLPVSQPSLPDTDVAVPIVPQMRKKYLYQQLYNIVYAINTNQPKSVIIGIVNNIISQLNSYPDF